MHPAERAAVSRLPLAPAHPHGRRRRMRVMTMTQASPRDPVGEPPDAAWPGSEPSLDLLLTAVAHGDQVAFEKVYERLAGPVYGLATRILRDQAQAEEGDRKSTPLNS